MSILFIAVTYRTPLQAESFVRQVIVDCVSKDLHVMIVDNGAESTTQQTVVASERLQSLLPGRNLGYFGGAAAGLEAYLRERGMPKWIVVSNVDLQFDVRQIETGLRKYEADRDIGVLAPGIISTNSDRPLNPFMEVRPTAARMHAYKWLFRWGPAFDAYNYLTDLAFRYPISWLRSMGMTRSALVTRDIYAPHGCFMIFSRDYFNRGGSLTHGTFLFGEEITVAERCRKLGLRVVYEPSIRIVHVDNHSTSKQVSASIRKYMAESAQYSADVYYPWRASTHRRSASH